jgi:tetratricopeptide (TPR) repeat protein
MGDSDTLTVAEERVLQRAQRKAVEEAGLYIESTFQDREKTEAGTSLQVSSLEIRTIAAAITKTEILESRRSFANDRPYFYVRIRAVVDLGSLKTAVQKWQSEQRFVEHNHRLQKENAALKTKLEALRTSPTGVRILTVEPVNHNAITQVQARTLINKAMVLQDLPLKLELTSRAARLAPQSIDPLILRGQTFLRLASAAHSNKTRPSEYSEYIDNARMDFDRALLIEPNNTWALLGKGDVDTWLNRPQEAVRSFEQALELAPFFDLARIRLIALYTAEARKLVALGQWSPALSILQKCLPPHLHDSWIPYQKDSYFLRSKIYQQLKQPILAIEDLSAILRVDPTDKRALLARAHLYHDELQGDSAKKDFEQACRLGSMPACNQLP